MVTIDRLAEITGCSCATIQVNAQKLRKMMSSPEPPKDFPDWYDPDEVEEE